MTLSEQVMVRLRGDQLARLRAIAEADERSIAYVVRKAIDLYLTRLTTERPGPAVTDPGRQPPREEPPWQP